MMPFPIAARRPLWRAVFALYAGRDRHGFPKLAFKLPVLLIGGAGYFYVAGTHNLLAELISDMQEMSR